jgi:predicted Zn-dependent protease
MFLRSRSVLLEAVSQSTRFNARTGLWIKRSVQFFGGSLMVFSAAAFAHAVDRCPQTGRYRLLTTSLEEDVAIGNRISHSLLGSVQRELVLPSSHPLTRICQRILDRIALSQPKEKHTFSFEIVIVSDSSDSIYSLPNGDIILHAGVLGSIRNEEELAGLLAHHMAHTILRHSSEVVSFSDLTRLPSGFLYSAVAVLGDGIISNALRWLAVEMTQPERMLMQVSYSENLLLEADRLGADLMSSAGYDPYQFLAYLELHFPEYRSSRLSADLKSISQPPLSKAIRRNPELEYWTSRISSQLV